MSEQSGYLPEAGMEWEREVRGYNRQQVDNYVAMQNGQIRERDSQLRDLRTKLSQALDEIERQRHELAEVSGRPPHEEISERVGQILKLAADEAKAERERVNAEISELRQAVQAETDKLRADTQEETDRLKAEAQNRAERMLAAAQEQSERAIVTARAEAEEMTSSAHASAEQMVADAAKHAESTIAAAVAQAKQHLDEATARATAIHEGAERRLNLLISRHTETVRRLTEIRDVVTNLVSGETARGSLEDEVARSLSAHSANGGDGRPSGQHDAAPAGAHRAQRQAGPADARRAAAPQGGPADDQEAAAQTSRQHAVQGGRAAADPLSGDPLTDPLPADPMAADRHDGGRYHGQPVEVTKHPDRVLDEAAAGSPGGRGLEN
jgi:hypothetical protein